MLLWPGRICTRLGHTHRVGPNQVSSVAFLLHTRSLYITAIAGSLRCHWQQASFSYAGHCAVLQGVKLHT